VKINNQYQPLMRYRERKIYFAISLSYLDYRTRKR